ncbi:MAG: multiheme c-type cytochrome [Rubripirellula sp.]|nr:multiheme c-type cytochrome [Rubripirellula sp.]
MNTTAIIIAGISGIALGLLAYRILRNWSIAIAIPLLVVAGAAVLIPEKKLPLETSPTVAVDPNLPDDSGKSVADSAETSIMTLASLQHTRPVEVPKDGYVGSDACIECHQDNHTTWAESYHSTMTQLATPDVVMGNLESVRLSFQGHDYEIHREGDVFWADLPDEKFPDVKSKRKVVPLVMSTGSHHMQLYWWATGDDRTTGLLPFVWVAETGEWIPRNASFLQPNVAVSQEIGRWGQTCSMCHSTHRRVRSTTSDTWDTKVAEFGISCEACHGPGQPHIDHHRQLALAVTNTSDGTSEIKQDPIANPESMDKVRSAQVCGQCHSVVELTGGKEGIEHLNMHGHGFRPGGDFAASHKVLRIDEHDATREIMDPNNPAAAKFNTTFYKDGMVRVSGREYNGLTDSACYKKGEMTCITCHQLHQSSLDDRPVKEWANDQLKPEALNDQICLDCHSEDQYNTSHTHHAAGSSGSSCYNCHMPHTTYGLLKAIRSHTITSPNVAKDVAAGRPNACNLCHLDKTLQWTADSLKKWYQIEPPELDKDQREIAASLLWILKGDAAQRALVAWSMGWPAAQAVSGTNWQMPFISQLLDDPYLAIRFIARRSLRSLEGLDDLKVNMFGPPEARQAAIAAIAQFWYETQESSVSKQSELLFGKDGLDFERVQRLLRECDNSPVVLDE